MAEFSNNYLFDYLKNILLEKSSDKMQKHFASEDFEKTFPRYMVVRYLSMHPRKEVYSVILENQLTFERFPSNRLLYKFLFDSIPQQNSGFIRYIK